MYNTIFHSIMLKLLKITYKHFKQTTWSTKNIKLTAKDLRYTVMVHPVLLFHLRRFYIKPSLAPFSFKTIIIYSWLQNVFLQYFSWRFNKKVLLRPLKKSLQRFLMANHIKINLKGKNHQCFINESR